METNQLIQTLTNWLEENPGYDGWIQDIINEGYNPLEYEDEEDADPSDWECSFQQFVANNFNDNNKVFVKDGLKVIHVDETSTGGSGYVTVIKVGEQFFAVGWESNSHSGEYYFGEVKEVRPIVVMRTEYVDA